MSVALTVLFVLVALALVAGGLYLFASGIAARAGVCRPPLGLRLRGVEPGSGAWERAGVLGTAHGIALAATAILGARVSVPLVFVVSGIIVEAGLWVVARGAGKASAT